MKLIRYRDGGVHLVEEPAPSLPEGGLLVQTEACGLCSGELMAWYMEKKGEPVLGHEVAGIVFESDHPAFPVGCRVFPHHHAPCGYCDRCQAGAFVQCETWRSTHLIPGGMAERFAVPAENLSDTHRVEDLRAVDAALAEPLACVMKSLRQGRWEPGQSAAVVGLGNMGLLHMLALGDHAVGFDTDEARRAHATKIGLTARSPEDGGEFDVVFVCPGAFPALEFAMAHVRPRGTVVLFAPFGPVPIPSGLLDRAYFQDITLAPSYSAGPDDSIAALELLRNGVVRAEQIVTEFVSIEELPAEYQRMKRAEIVKAMVTFPREI